MISSALDGRGEGVSVKKGILADVVGTAPEPSSRLEEDSSFEI